MFYRSTLTKDRLKRTNDHENDKDGPIGEELKTTIMKIMRKYKGKFLEIFRGGGSWNT
jgi:hypothetical protein